ncbi:hypothetical protein EV401DRAFT_1884680 [Pisolithus croceorrhizus]|nr:hypothetical protein EV401DRAFT_1884680 [Pisolithus croceorrhizus]
MFSKALLIACVILFFEMPATLGAAIVRSSWYTLPPFSPPFTKFTALSSTATTQATYAGGLMWKGYEHQVIGYGHSDVPHPTPTLNSPKDRSVVASVQRAPSSTADTVWAGTENQNVPRRLRREEDTSEGQGGLMWKGREHEEAIQDDIPLQGRVDVERRDVAAPGALQKNRVHLQSN